MLITIEHGDFKRLSPAAQKELIDYFSGAWPSQKKAPPATAGLRWREPVDLSADQAVRLIHGLSDDHRRRLKLFARKNGRVRVSEILKLTGETDLRATSDFQKEMTRRLRRLIKDPERKAQLIAWDFEATKWDASQTMIVEGMYYVSQKTAETLKSTFKAADKAG